MSKLTDTSIGGLHGKDMSNINSYQEPPIQMASIQRRQGNNSAWYKSRAITVSQGNSWQHNKRDVMRCSFGTIGKIEYLNYA